MTRSIFGWDLPPGCSHGDIERAAGGEDPSPESEEVCGILETQFPTIPQDILDKVVTIVDDLARDRAYARMLLEQAFRKMPPDPVLTCTCTPKEEYSWCELHDGTGEPTLRQEIETYLKGGK